MKKKIKTNEIPNFVIIGLLIFTILIFSYTMKDFFLSKKINNQITGQTIGMNKMTLTEYDKNLARRFMDKNHDGRCDVCGMQVDMCIDSGQLQCNMAGESAIGELNSQHIHADWKIYINGMEFDWLPYADLHKKQMMGDKNILGTSAFIHIHPSQLPEKAGDVIHMHAKGIPLWIFFESLGMKFNKDCLILDTGEEYCNDGANALKFYVNGQENNQYENYIFNDLDKILISYGDENQIEIQEQLNTITNFAGTH